MRAIASSARTAVQKAWWWLRQVSGDAAYENYLRSASKGEVKPCTHPPLTREQFFLDALGRRYSGVNRCC